MTFAFTICPTSRASFGDLIWFMEICEICTRPVTLFPKSTKAPYGWIDSTFPSTTEPTSIFETAISRCAFLAASLSSRRISLADKTSLFLSISASITRTLISLPSQSRVSSTWLMSNLLTGINPRTPSTKAITPLFTIPEIVTGRIVPASLYSLIFSHANKVSVSYSPFPICA